MRTLPLILALVVPLAALAQDADERADFVVAVQTPEGEPVAGASVLLGANRGAATDADGQAVFEGVAPGRYPVRVSFLGKTPREVAAVLEAPGPWGLIVEVADATNLLYDVVVEARSLEGTRLERDGFFDRQALGGGTILDAEDIARRNPIFLSDLLRGTVPGVRVQQGSLGEVAVSSRGGAGGCVMDVYLDGMRSPALTDDLRALPAQGVVALEAYRGPSRVPLQYRQLGFVTSPSRQIGQTGIGRSSGCGVVLVWTELSIAEAR